MTEHMPKLPTLKLALRKIVNFALMRARQKTRDGLGG